MKNPYALSNFAQLRKGGFFYADKTPFLTYLEDSDTGRYVIFLRPRRFGKSLLISLMEHYYDLAQAPAFDALFSGLAVHRTPTPLANRFLVLRLDFSVVDVQSGKEALSATFLTAIRASVGAFLRKYEKYVPAYIGLLARLDRVHEPNSVMIELFAATQDSGHEIYLLVDEYDNFLNELISARNISLYYELVQGGGFVRSFYKTLKAATATGVVSRLFITGVSPMTLDDLSSGFNIGRNQTLKAQINALCGFTQAEVEQAVDLFLHETPHLAQRDPLLVDLRRFYNGYLFSEDASERIYNPDMVLYFLQELRQKRGYPKELLDPNVRTDYGKLVQLARPPEGKADWHRELMDTLLIEGRVRSPLVEQFGARRLYEHHHLTSLMCFMGLLTIGPSIDGESTMEVPNQVVRTLHWEELALLLREQAGVHIETLDLQGAVSRMAYHGEIDPFLELLRDGVLKVLSNRDLMKFDEKHLKMIMLTYLSMSPIFRPLSEKEFAQGYGDLFLALDRRFPDARYAYLIELKHLRSGADEDEIAKARAEAEAQLGRYLIDDGLLPALTGGRTLKAVAVIFCGASAYHCFDVRTVLPSA